MTTEQEKLPRLTMAAGINDHLLCPTCGSSPARQFAYVEPVEAYRKVRVFADGSIRVNDYVHHEGPGQGGARLFHEACMTYFDPESVTA